MDSHRYSRGEPARLDSRAGHYGASIAERGRQRSAEFVRGAGRSSLVVLARTDSAEGKRATLFLTRQARMVCAANDYFRNRLVRERSRLSDGHIPAGWRNGGELADRDRSPSRSV